MKRITKIVESLAFGLFTFFLGILIWVWSNFSLALGIHSILTRVLVGLAFVLIGVYIVLVDKRLVKEENEIKLEEISK